MDIKRKVSQPNGQGNAASECSDYVARACSMQYGKDARYNDIIAEGREEDTEFGVPNSNEDSTSDRTQYGLRGAEQHPVKIVSEAK